MGVGAGPGGYRGEQGQVLESSGGIGAQANDGMDVSRARSWKARWGTGPMLWKAVMPFLRGVGPSLEGSAGSETQALEGEEGSRAQSQEGKEGSGSQALEGKDGRKA